MSRFTKKIVWLAIILQALLQSQQVFAAENLQLACRASIAAIMGRDMKTIRVYKTQNQVVFVRYTRKSDNKLWRNKCKLSEDRVIWASVDLEGLGRWRDNPEDEVVKYTIKKRSITISQIFGDGTVLTDQFKF